MDASFKASDRSVSEVLFGLEMKENKAQDKYRCVLLSFKFNCLEAGSYC